MFSIKWNDGHGDWQINFSDFSRARGYLNGVFHQATLTDRLGTVIGGVRPVREEERRSRRHKWVRWIEGDVIGTRTTEIPRPTTSTLDGRRRIQID